MDSTFNACAYCWKDETSWDELLYFKCDGCSKKVHYGCIKSNQPSPLLDDTFFTFKCEGCAEDGKEDFVRMKISWQDTVALTLYHLQKTNQGRCGFFHWRGHICAFIDTNWRCLFGLSRKKTTLWVGTVAGTLSSRCPDLFTSGANVVESGYWRLTHLKPPLPHVEKKRPGVKKKVVSEPPVYLNPEERRCRRQKDNALIAAMELKEKQVAVVTKGRGKSRTTAEKGRAEYLSTSKPQKQNKKGKDKASNLKMESKIAPAEADAVGEDLWADTDINLAPEVSDIEDAASAGSSSVTMESSLSSSMVSYTQDDAVEVSSSKRLDFLNAIKVEAEDDDDELDIDIGSMSTLDMPDFRPESPDLNSVLGCVSVHSTSGATAGKSPVAQNEMSAINIIAEPEDREFEEGCIEGDLGDSGDSGGEEEGAESDKGTGADENDSDDSGDGEMSEASERAPQSDSADVPVRKKKGRPRKRRRMEDSPPASPPPRLEHISVFEERELLQRLNDSAKLQPLRLELAQLRRKLICNQTNREFGLPVFDLDKQVEKLTSTEGSENNDHFQRGTFFPKFLTRATSAKETRDLDRFMMQSNNAKAKCRTYTTFQQRLVGLEDHELKPMVSPYTTRVLLPFIWRNYKPSKIPLKLKLLQEIQAYPHRNDPLWTPPPSPPVDFCYVRPEHIPSVNALCREFFWPGIDISECLQYPDFSCVVLYRKIVIAFAFMVPDRGYNEAYISFIFTHPEWRGVGISTFMLYHLIQTCMGKDVLLHVSATNPAMLLYQKFGFKAQELILNFYYKYFPYDCKDSTHAFLMRLSR